LEVVCHELAAVVVAQLEATCAVLGEGAEARPYPLPDRLEGLEAGSLAHCGARRYAALILESGEPRRGGLCEIACRPPVDTYNPAFLERSPRATLVWHRIQTSVV
jgi:hypothetical protein